MKKQRIVSGSKADNQTKSSTQTQKRMSMKNTHESTLKETSGLFSSVMTSFDDLNTDREQNEFTLFYERIEAEQPVPYEKLWSTDAEVTNIVQTTMAKHEAKVDESKRANTAPPTANPRVCIKCGHTQPKGWESSICAFNMYNIHRLCSKSNLATHNEKCEECKEILKSKALNEKMLESQKQEWLFNDHGNLEAHGIDPHFRNKKRGLNVIHHTVLDEEPTQEYVEAFDLEDGEDTDSIQRVKIGHTYNVDKELGSESVEEALGVRNPVEDQIFENSYASLNPLEGLVLFANTNGLEGTLPLMNYKFEENKQQISRLNPMDIEYDFNEGVPNGAYIVDMEEVLRVKSRSATGYNPYLVNTHTYETIRESNECECKEGSKIEREVKTWDKGNKIVEYKGYSENCGRCGKKIVYEESSRNINDYLKLGYELPKGLGKIEAQTYNTAVAPVMKKFIGNEAVKMLYRLRNRIRALNTTEVTSNEKPLTKSDWTVRSLLEYGATIDVLQKIPRAERMKLTTTVLTIKSMKRNMSDPTKIKYLENKMKTALHMNIVNVNKSEESERALVIGESQPPMADYGAGAEIARRASDISGSGILVKHNLIMKWTKYVETHRFDDGTPVLDGGYWKVWRKAKAKMAHKRNPNNVVVVGIVGASQIPSDMKKGFKARITQKLKSIQAELKKQKKAMIVVSGGARGVDSFAVEIAESLNIPTVVFNPEEQSWSKGFKARNHLIAVHSHRLLNFVLKQGEYKQCPKPEYNEQTGKMEFAKPEDWKTVKYDTNCTHCIDNTSYHKDDKPIDHQKSGGCYTRNVCKNDYGSLQTETITCDYSSVP